MQTIIECLKYATTGEQPPNTRGGAFVHDPVLAGEREVKAQVKLRFNAATGTRMLAVRNLQVSRKKTGGLTMKTLENILSVADGAEGSKVCRCYTSPRPIRYISSYLLPSCRRCPCETVRSSCFPRSP